MNTVTLHEQVSLLQQAVEFRGLYRLSADDTPIRVIVHRDPYDFQSWGKVERWSGSQWHEVWTIPGSNLHTVKHITVVKDWHRLAYYRMDVDVLMARAAEVLE